MLPAKHAFYGFLFSVIFSLIFSVDLISFLVLFLSTFLTDVDHYIVYVFKKRDLNLKRAYEYYIRIGRDIFSKKEKLTYQMMFFHSIEMLVLLVLLSVYFEILFYVACGFLFHFVLDAADEIAEDKPHSREFSIIQNYIEKKG